MHLAFHQVDAFATKPFTGNPAMVYRLEQWLPDSLMQQIAAEHNLAETAFMVREGAAWHIRWFTPAVEVPLCGHATLASARVLFDCYDEPGERLEFISQSGPLNVTREGDLLVLNFPAIAAQSCAMPLELAAIMGVAPGSFELLEAQNNLLLVLVDEAAVRGLKPDMARLAALPYQGLIATAPGQQHDFVSRYFAPAIGINEDPVTGFAHCILTPFWAARFKRDELSAYQCSARGGELHCRLRGERVHMAGSALRVASGQLQLDESTI